MCIFVHCFADVEIDLRFKWLRAAFYSPLGFVVKDEL